MVDQVETPLADFAKKYVPWAGDIVALWFPPAGVFAKLIANAPLSDFEKYLRNRASGGRLQVMGAATPADAVSAAPPEVNDYGAPPIEVAPKAPPTPTILEVDDLLRQYDEVRESQPFRVALGLNLQLAVTELETFMQETVILTDQRNGASNGLWPAFAIEWKLRRSLTNRLGATAILSNHPTLKSLIDTDLAAGLIDALTAAGPTPEQPRTLTRLMRVFAASGSYKWPIAQGFRPGYVLANVTSPHAIQAMPGASAEAIGADAKQDGDLLVDRLARLSDRGRDELTRVWLRSCAASELSQSQRAALGAAPNPFLSRLEHPLIHIDRADLLDAIRDDVEACIDLHGAKDQLRGAHSLYVRLDALTEAYATNNARAFDQAVTTLTLLRFQPANSAIWERVQRVIELLKRERQWK